jgi:hypothetical protein
MRFSTFAFALLLCGCGPAPRPTDPVPPPEIHDVHWTALTRDYPTASSYAGRTVRVRLAKGEYAHEGNELRVWANDRTVPAILLIRLAAPPPPGDGPLVVVGTCRGATRDGVWRSPRADYFVTVTEATASVP